MYLREKLDKKELIKLKIKELRDSLLVNTNIAKSDEIVKVLLDYIDVLQNINLIINKVNQQTIINIGDSSITVAVAIEIRKAIKTKISVITSLMATDNKVLDILILLKQRDDLIEEYNGINNTIRIADWSVKLD